MDNVDMKNVNIENVDMQNVDMDYEDQISSIIIREVFDDNFHNQIDMLTQGFIAVDIAIRLAMSQDLLDKLGLQTPREEELLVLFEFKNLYVNKINQIKQIREKFAK